MKAKAFFLVLYLGISLLLFAFFDASIGVWLSFLCSQLLLTTILFIHLFVDKEYSPFLSAYIVFFFLFFTVAPIIQINSLEPNAKFMTNFPYRPDLVIYTNFMTCLFHGVFIGSYFFFKKIPPLRKVPTITNRLKGVLPVWISILFGISLLVFVVSIGFVLNEISRPSWMASPYSTALLLIYKKVLFLIPFAGVLLCVQYLVKGNKKALNLVIVGALMLAFLALLLWFKNPLTEKRNALGPIYISLIFLFLPKLLNTNFKTLFFLFFTMVILFPLSAIFTHSDATFEEIYKDPMIFFDQMKGGGVTSAFNTLNYDAFANFMTTIDYVQQEGLTWGHQLLSGIFFFVPRGVWESKPETTGIFIGDYLISDYRFGYNNLSNPFPSEGYINFGVVGVVLMAILLALVIVKLLSWLKSNDYIKKIMAFYFAIHLIFLLRGDFANAYSYYIGILAGVWVIPKLIGKTIEWYSIRSSHGKRSE